MNDRAKVVALLAVTLTAASAVMYWWTKTSAQPPTPTGYELTIDLNTATPTELAWLPGVGPALAQRIVEERDKRGGFGSVNDLESVPGIGPARLEAIAARVTISSPAQDHPPAGERGESAGPSGPAGSGP
ncbi:MAG: helix-hairpin-helix domain-containing protein [Phycisphaeraceae bacterium]|nr:helix-hairpin-helix domain-containing protein [Phycisphaeraceae bacterium]